MLLKCIFKPFVEKRPFCVMVRAALERMLSPLRLDQLFRDQAKEQYERELLFSSLVELMGQVVTGIEPSVLASYRTLKDQLGVSDEAVYQKLRGVETNVAEALVRDSFAQAHGVIRHLKGFDLPWVRGKQVKVLDGNLLSATERRIKELRTMWDAPLPGRALVVWDQQSRLVENVILTENGYASERSLLDQVLETVAANDLWIADRNFCTLGFLFGLWVRKARFVIRQHGTFPGILQGKRHRVGKTKWGEPVWEQTMTITYEGRTRTVRRITIHLRKPTRDGDRELHILTNLTPREASAVKVADLYGKRWTIEVVFLEMQTALCCEVNTLGYPRAALFAFCVAIVLENTFSMLKCSLRSVHGATKIDEETSGILLSQELKKAYDGMMVQIPPKHWTAYSTMPLKEFAGVLKYLAQNLDPARYPKHPRGPKKPPPEKRRYRNGGHVATAEILALRNHPP
jgi:hypothetical protein